MWSDAITSNSTTTALTAAGWCAKLKAAGGAEQGARAPALKKSEESLHSAAQAASCARQGWSAGCWIAWPAASSTKPSGAYVLPAHDSIAPQMGCIPWPFNPQDSIEVNSDALCQAPTAH